MRLIAGLAKGMPLSAPPGGDVRPTADRVRAAIFSSLGPRVAGAGVLDLFAGTGGLGLEAASRGAGAVTFVEQAAAALECLGENLDRFRRRCAGDCALAVLAVEARSQIEQWCGHRAFDLIFADPPYGPLAQALLDDPLLPRLLAADGRFILESARRVPLTVSAPWEPIREASYGDTCVSFFRLLPEVRNFGITAPPGPWTHPEPGAGASI